MDEKQIETLAKQIAELLGPLTEEERQEVMLELRNEFCFDCGSTEGWACHCQRGD